MEGPLLGVRVPEQLGRQIDGFWAPGLGGVQLAVVLQAFDDPHAQDCLGKICALYVGAGVRLIGVEAADGPIRSRPGNTDIRHLIATETVSAGVLSLLNAGNAAVDVFGVDDVSLIPPSHQAMAVVSAARESREEIFREVIRPLLERAQQSHYPGELAQLRRARLSVYGSRKTMAEQARLARAAASGLGLDMASFPLVTRFLEMAEQEKSQRPGVIQAQQEEFLKRVMGRVHGWYRPAGPNRLDIDLRKAAPVLQYWVEETGQSLEEFQAAFSRQNLEQAGLSAVGVNVPDMTRPLASAASMICFHGWHKLSGPAPSPKSRFAGRGILIASRFAGWWVILNRLLASDTAAGSCDPAPIPAKSAVWTNPVHAGQRLFAVDSL